MDLVIRNARVFGRPAVDIGIDAATIVAVEANISADALVYDAEGHLTCAGLVETHIHLDKTRIIDRCAPEEGRNANAVPRVAAVKSTFTEEDVYQRAAKSWKTVSSMAPCE
jgi:cytosine/creatinine deaminase